MVAKEKVEKYYDIYLSRILKSVSSNHNITNNAKNQLNSVLVVLSKVLCRNAATLARISSRKTLTQKDVEASVVMLLEGNLLTKVLQNAKISLEQYNKNLKNKGESRQKKANIHISPSVVEKLLRLYHCSPVEKKQNKNKEESEGENDENDENDNSDDLKKEDTTKRNSNLMISKLAPVFLAAVINFIAQEMLELAVAQNEEDNSKKVRLTIKDVELGVRKNKDLNTLRYEHD